ncbi:helix-turn-helix domain-containing protein [Nocardia sp. NPDC058176]|uniref:helix-turn-helix domain-containing protein n=1 Tax=Nocardia sp. NPDC058176 TaxID=3346368 RepID=UPI0036D91F91
MTRRDPDPGRAAVSRSVGRGFDPDRLRRERLAEEGTLRHAAGLPEIEIADLARLTGVSPTAIYNWESRLRAPHATLLKAVADELNVPMDVLVVVAPEKRTLADLRWLAGMFQTGVATQLGITTQTYGRIERGNRAIGKDLAIALAKLYDVEVDVIDAAWQRAHRRPAGAKA